MIKLKSLINEKFEDWNDEYWVHYSDVDYLKINKNHKHNDPDGIYLFPLKFKNHEISVLFREKKYKIYVTISPNLKILDLGEVTRKVAIDLLIKMGSKHLVPEITDVEKIKDRVRGSLYLQNNPDKITIPYLFWKTFCQFHHNRSDIMRKTLLDLGFNAVFDDVGVILNIETQLIILNEDDVKIVKILPNDLK